MSVVTVYVCDLCRSQTESARAMVHVMVRRNIADARSARPGMDLCAECMGRPVRDVVSALMPAVDFDGKE
jgi:hypothetical protein